MNGLFVLGDVPRVHTGVCADCYILDIYKMTIDISLLAAMSGMIRVASRF